MVLIVGCRYCMPEHLRLEVELHPHDAYHMCNLCNGHDESYFTGNNLERLFSIIEQQQAQQWLMTFTRSNKESWDNPSCMFGQIFDQFIYNGYDFNGSNVKCVMLRLKNEAIRHKKFNP